MRARQFWNIKNWHWVSSAICLVGMLLFSVTGITLNHPTVFEGDAEITQIETDVPSAIMAGLNAERPLSQAFRQWYQSTTGNPLPDAVNAQWSEFEMYVSLPRAGVTVGFQSTESYIPFIKKPQTVAGLLISTIYTKAATLTFYGRCLSMSSHWPPFYFQ